MYICEIGDQPLSLAKEHFAVLAVGFPPTALLIYRQLCLFSPKTSMSDDHVQKTAGYL